jgi:hypothetical protein
MPGDFIRVCTKCGDTSHSAIAQFCQHCGGPVEARSLPAPPPPSDAPMAARATDTPGSARLVFLVVLAGCGVVFLLVVAAGAWGFLRVRAKVEEQRAVFRQRLERERAESEKRLREADDLSRLEQCSTVEDYEALLAHTTNETVRRRAEEALDDLAFQAAEKAGTRAAFERYLRGHADGKNAAAAKERLGALDADAAEARVLVAALDARDDAGAKQYVARYAAPQDAAPAKAAPSEGDEGNKPTPGAKVEAALRYLRRHPLGPAARNALAVLVASLGSDPEAADASNALGRLIRAACEKTPPTLEVKLETEASSIYEEAAKKWLRDGFGRIGVAVAFVEDEKAPLVATVTIQQDRGRIFGGEVYAETVTLGFVAGKWSDSVAASTPDTIQAVAGVPTPIDVSAATAEALAAARFFPW